MVVPKVSVIMPVYNAERFISETINSILSQSFTNFEFLITDDCSSDGTLKIISSFKDPRITVFVNETNIGYVRILNQLINISAGDYIARQDHDDISVSDRLGQQILFMDNNPEVGICGCNAKMFGTRRWISSVPTEDSDIRAAFIMRNPYVHSSVLMRRSIFQGDRLLKYNNDYYPAEDYSLWFEISLIAKLANLPSSLLQYRTHSNNVSHLNGKDQIEKANAIRVRILEITLSISLTDEEKRLHNLFSTSNQISLSDLKSLEKWYLKILTYNKVKKYYSDKALNEILLKYWTHVCFFQNNILFPKMIYLYFTSKLFRITLFMDIFSMRTFMNYILRR